ncbi:MAG: BlaI/MecI/CopY family transcriptional regulator [Candidatus Sumerlaeia bacterium]
MTNPAPLDLGRRERQIMEIVYAKGQASVSDVLDALPDPPSYSAVRAMLNLLEEKGHLRRKASGRKFLYIPTVPRAKARRAAIRNLLQTFFGGSVGEAIASMIEQENLSGDDLDRLSELIDHARKEGR